MSAAELLGYAASFFVVMSLLMRDIKRLRYINLLGCLLFVVYGLIIAAYPVAVMNAVAALINVYQLWRLRSGAGQGG
ncbi:MAG: hypothetical protein CSA51_04330 [Gammaproteobacteria bacterium]|nr:MAG: hypothetical protein CSA51_04330 [Gammaproteobacteria bacterium]